ncbi:hypothetical protein AEP_01658 [Curvibacter sp. AEP1-3]|uniref:DDE-type integrase/transposase/recombinase n=1 Tax=Curvibacter sp. AEP1-3 TaxID=1844971 RepID=UPI000B3BF608|nr:DDE-type integrase/transposase/recombinase [Curvibacter sp. AEP1-3]ARV18602.1 hypothetical protein AEP_01658 [Curvibacter sp. AEP1-3]
MVWTYDFFFDTTADGRQFNFLTVVDECTPECPSHDVALTIRYQRVTEVFSRLVSLHGAPLFILLGNGPEFVSHTIFKWVAQADIGTSLSDLRKRCQNETDATFMAVA